jgi:septin 7
MEEEKREHDSKMKKMEAEMEQVFEMKVKEKKQKLKDSELEMTRRHDERKKVSKKENSKKHRNLMPNKLFRLLKCKRESSRSDVRPSSKRKSNGRHRMVSRWKSCEGRVWKRTAKSEF